ncbi:CSLREA domain-containing protein [Acinetobacter sp. WZC-1]|uniref:CSLREA domain-containing protein n=1 Tax=Acinetobacter sp. WZC-1 TaxID=3459034 RepID=UPI00403D92AC
MKNYKKAILTVAILSTMSLMAADDKTIYVNTFADEDGENTNQCSLREAVTAASTYKAYGGCPAGQRSVTNIIQLQAGEYNLTRELQPDTALIIRGQAPVDYSRPDGLSNSYPAATPLKTTISGQGQSRIINSALSKPSLTLANLILKDGFSPTVGGALYVSGSTTLNNVSVENSKAQQAGGAIYLSDNSSLTIVNGNYHGNDAVRGSVFAMSCLDNLDNISRNVTVSSTSLIGNGSANSLSSFEFCGKTTVNFTASTIAQNTASAASGSIFQFSSNTPRGKVGLVDGSSLVLLSNTIVQNSAWSTLLYNSTGSKALSNNVLAYNGPGKSCRYADGDVSAVENSGISLVNNAIKLAPGEDRCDLPNKTVEDITASTLDLSTISFSSVLSPLQQPNENTGFMALYFPLDIGTNKDLVDTGAFGCSARDQRGAKRTASVNSTGQNEVENNCDIGATELLRLTAYNNVKTNSSVVTLLDNYQQQYDTYTSLIANPATNPDFLPYYRLQQTYYDNLKRQTQSRQKYRTIFVDPFAENSPDEETQADGTRKIRPLSAENYEVSVEKLGTGKLDANSQYTGTSDPNLRCEWSPELQQIMMWRVDDLRTADGDAEFCRYTLKLKNSSPEKTSSAYVVGSFTNIAPIAENTSYDIQYGTLQKISVNLLDHASDDGDGLTSALTDKPNKPAFYVDASGQQLAVRVDGLPDPVALTAEHSGPCPDDSKLTCYGGKMQLQIKNTFDPFNYNFKYYVYDAEGKVSNEATVTLNNSASAPGSPAIGGGGSVDWHGLLGLLGLMGLRRFYSRKKV